MKTRLFFALLFLFTPLYFQAQPEPPSYFVVIGAFAIKENAEKHVLDAKTKSLEPIQAINPLRKLTYVYTLKSDQPKPAFAEAARIRSITPYADTWVFFGRLGDIQEAVGTPVSLVTNELTSATPTPAEIVENTQPVVEPVQEEPKPPAKIIRKPEDGKDFLFKVMSGNEPLKVTVDILDRDRKKKLKSVNGNEQVLIKPLIASGKWKIICETMGYRPHEMELDYFSPEKTPGVEVTPEGEVLISIDLKKAIRGDMLRTYHVLFYEDASVMRPESQDEVDALKQMMVDNPEFKIKIHGHTNGNYGGKIISKEKTDADFFNLTNIKEGKGSARKLSEMRAEAIRDYLIASGIDAKRMEVEAWGGKKPLEDPYSDRAGLNSRVEIEIL
jgi:outer membrane protein OmpA-like peptidoglycan-associated protein